MILTVLALASGDSIPAFSFLHRYLAALMGQYKGQVLPLGFSQLLLAALAFIALVGGYSIPAMMGSEKPDGPSGDWSRGLITDVRKEKKLVGLAAMVMVDGKVVASAAHGERKKGSGVPMSSAIAGTLGSSPRSHATMIARLIESGRMKWTDHHRRALC